ncbi:MAG TPA: hypothetical protein PLJ10_00975 [Candidatus Hydrogenedens sp.]|nr:hypothetical protein [Candidatus Hydrogenedens sp.]
MLFIYITILFSHAFIEPYLLYVDDTTPKNWLSSDPSIILKIQKLDFSHNIFNISVSKSDNESKWHYVYYDIPIIKEQFVYAKTYIRLVDKKDSLGVGVTIGFIDENGNRIDFVEERLTEPTKTFVPIHLYGKTPIGTSKIRVTLFIHNQGALECYEPIISTPWHLEQKQNEVTLHINNKPLKKKLLGFGAEDDGRFYDTNNKIEGVDDEAVQLRKERIISIQPHWVRTFAWFKDWDPKDDGLSFTFDSDGMQSLYKTIEEYQKLNTIVNITCVNWGIPYPWEDVDKRTNSIVALLKHLIKNKGFNNIKYFTLTNEPNYFFYTKGNRFDKYKELHKKLKERFKKEGLSIQIVGSDDAMGTDWFQKCLEDKDYQSYVNIWASHFYWQYNTVYFADKLFHERIELMNKYVKNNKHHIFTVTEFGVTDQRFKPPSINPIMQEYKGALYSVALIIDGLNQGVSGYSLWCLQEVRYPGLKEPMRMGLWGYKDKNWQIYPMYYAMKMFTNNTAQGNKIYPIKSSNPTYFKSVRLGNRIFWVNLSDKEIKVKFNKKLNMKSALYYEGNENNVHDITENKDYSINREYIRLPKESFGIFKF